MTQEKLGCLWEDFAGNMSSCLCDIGYIKCIKMDIDTNPNLPFLLQKHTHFLLKIMNRSEGVRRFG